MQNGRDDGAPDVGFAVGAALAEGAVDAVKGGAATDVGAALAEAVVATGPLLLDESHEQAAKRKTTKRRFIGRGRQYHLLKFKTWAIRGERRE